MLRYAIPRFLLPQPYSRQLPLSLLGAMVVAILSYLDKGRAEDVSRSLVDHQQRTLTSSHKHAGTIGTKARHLHISDSTRAHKILQVCQHIASKSVASTVWPAIEVWRVVRRNRGVRLLLMIFADRIAASHVQIAFDRFSFSHHQQITPIFCHFPLLFDPILQR